MLTFHQIHNTIIILSSPEGAKLHCQLRWGAMAGSPLDPPLPVTISGQTQTHTIDFSGQASALAKSSTVSKNLLVFYLTHPYFFLSHSGCLICSVHSYLVYP